MTDERPPASGPEQQGPPPGGPQPPSPGEPPRPQAPAGPTQQPQPYGWTGQQPPGAPPPPPLPPPPGGYSIGEAGPIPTLSGGRAPRLQEMRVGELLDASITLYRRNWKTFMGIVAFVLVPIQFLQSFLTRTVGGPFTSPEDLPVEPDAGVFVATAVFGAATYLFVVPFLTGAIARATSQIYLGDSPTVGDVYRFALTRTHTILWVSFLATIVTIFGFVALIVPGLIFLVRFTFATSVVVVEGSRGRASMKRSWRLARGAFWKILGLMILSGILTSIVAGILQFPLEFAAEPLGDNGWILRAVGASTAAIVTRPFQGILTVLLYFDMRIRKEGFDLALMAQELERPLEA